MKLTRRTALASLGSLALVRPARANTPIRIGVISSQSGPFAAVGRQLEGGIRTYMKMNGDEVAGKKIELIVRDDMGVAETTRRVAQELVANEKVNFLAGFTLTPGALATAPIATQARTPMVVMLGATSIIPDRSPFIVRSSMSMAQIGVPYGEWMAKQGVKSMVTLVSDYGPGLDVEKFVSQGFEENGGKVLTKLRVPLANPEFAPFIQRAMDAKPEVLFVFVPAGGAGIALMTQIRDRGLMKQGILVFSEGTVLDDDILDSMGDMAAGVVTAHNYSAAHDSEKNRAYRAAYKELTGRRSNLVSTYAFDGMHLIYEALKKTNGSTEAQKNLDAMMGLSWESPRGPVTMDPGTRDLIQNVYIRRAERRDGEMWNVEFDTIKAVRDPTRGAK